MRKINLTISILAAAGLVASIILFIQHFNPAIGYKIISCGTEGNNPCMTISQSQYGKFLGISLPSFGILFYTFFLLSSLVSLFSTEQYKKLIMSILFPLAALSVIIDIVLFSILIRMGLYCNLCITTYLINISILGIIIWWIISIKKEKISLSLLYKELFAFIKDKKNIAKTMGFSLAAIALLIITIGIDKGIAAKGNSHAGHGHAGHQHNENFDPQQALNEFYALPKETITFTNSNMIMGENPEQLYVTLHVFTDFLCAACNKFKSYTPLLAEKFKKNIQIVFHHYPLEKECNPSLNRDIHPGACKMSKAFYAATKMGHLKEFSIIHLKNFEKYYARLRDDFADFAIDEFFNEMKFTAQQKDQFRTLMGSDEAATILNNDIRLAINLQIRSTPTIFINSRRVVGVMGINYFETIIKTEIEGKGQY